MLPHHLPPCGRHQCIGGGHGEGLARTGAEKLVLPHRRFRLRPPDAGLRRAGGARGRRHGSGRGAPSPRGFRFRLVPAAGAGLQGAGHRAGQCGRGHHHRHQAGGGIRHRQGRAGHRGPAHGHQRHQGFGARCGPGALCDRGLLLGRQRQGARFRKTLRRAQWRQDPHQGPCGQLHRRAPLSRRGGRCWLQGLARGHGEDARIAHRLSRQARAHARGWPRDL